MLHTFNPTLESLDGFETDFVKTLYYDLPKNYSNNYNSYSYLRFCTILTGEKELIVDYDKIKYTKDQYLILPSNTSVTMNIPKQTKALVFEISDDLITQVSNKIQKKETSIKKINNSNFILENTQIDVSNDIQAIHNITKRKSKSEAFLIDLYAQKLIYDLLQIYSIDQLIALKSTEPLARSINYIKNHIKEPIPVNVLSKMACMSESNYSHLFKKTYGKSPQIFINDCKLDLACNLLKNNSVTDVSYDLGYENISYFIRLFKRKYNTTPKQYQLNKLNPYR